jgi:N-ethylmaleimide reductase
MTSQFYFTHSPRKKMMSKLMSPVKVGPYSLSHRVVLAPLTRLRSEQPSDTASDMMAVHYAQRATEGGLLIAESTSISISSRSYLGAPGIYKNEHIAGWKKTTKAVHDKGGKIFLQLFHGGRQSHVDMTGGTAPVAPSVAPYEGVAMTADGFVPASPHRALDITEIPVIMADYVSAAERALAAGFDGVELHAANGYLPDQFLQDGSNLRTDAYGGSIENRARFLLEALNGLVAVWGADRVGVRIAPSGQWGDVSDTDPEATFGYLAKKLDAYGLAYLHVIEPRIKGDSTLVEDQEPVASSFIRKHYSGVIMAAGGFDGAGAEAILQRGDADLVAFGRHFAANPDLPKRLAAGASLNEYDRSTFWGGDEKGYNDYPTLESTLATA